MSPEQMQHMEALASFLRQQIHVGKTPTVRKTAIEHFDAISTMINEYNLMLTHINTCPIAASEAERGNVPMRKNGGNVPPQSEE